MAKKPGPKAGSFGNTDYYYKEDGTIVDQDGVPAPAKMAAIFGPPPVVETVAKKTVRKKLPKNNAQVAGVLSNTKYFYTPDGLIVDESGRLAPDKIAAYFPPQEKREAIAAAMPTPPGKTRTAPVSAGIPDKVIKEFNKNVTISTDLIVSQQKIAQAYPKLFENIANVVFKLTQHTEEVVRAVIDNNQAFQDKVIETLTGERAPTQAAGAVRPKPGRRGAGRTASKKARSAAVMARARRMQISNATRKYGMGMAIGAGFAAGAIAAVATAPSGAPGGGGGPIPDYNGPGVAATGSAREAIDFFISKGWTKEQAIGIAANIEVESKFKTNALGDGGKAYGIAQWHPDRQAKFQQVYGKAIRESNFQEQLEFVNWELNNTEKKAGNIIRTATSAAQAAALVDQHYERSSGAHRQIRVNIAQKYEKGEGLSGTSTQSTPGAPTTTASTSASPAGSPQQTIPGDQSTASVNIPSGDIVAAGRALQQMGIRVSEHPAFGSVGQHARNSAHYSGRAIDVNAPGSVVEANDPVWGPKFDQIASALRAAGYKVIWRSAGHDNHLHAELPSGAAPASPQGIPGATYAGIQTPQMAAMSQGYAMNRVAAACDCGPSVIINRTVTNDITRMIHASAPPQFEPAHLVGAAIGSFIRKLF